MNFRGIAGSLSFAHLAGLASAKKAKKGDKEEADPKCEDDDAEEAEHADNVERDGPGEDEHDNRGAKKGKKAKNKKADAEDGDPDDDDDDEDEDDEENEHKDGEDDDGRMKKGRKEGRKAERARIGAILNHPAAARNLQLAARLACNTGMSVGAVVALLESQPAAGRGSLATKMETNRPPAVGPGADSGGGGPAADSAQIQAGWDASIKRVFGKLAS